MLSFEDRLALLQEELDKKTPEELAKELASFKRVGRPASEFCKSFKTDLGFVTNLGEEKIKGMEVDKSVTFYDTETKLVEAVYFYNKGVVNYLLSWGFEKGSLGELRAKQAKKAKKPYFSFALGWHK